MVDGGVEIRAARAEEADEFLRVLCAAFALNFEAARPIFYQDPFFDLSHKRLLRTPEEGLISCLTIIPVQIRVGTAWVPMGGLAGVATRPDLQGRGWGSRLLAATVSSLADELGYPLSGLFPVYRDYYRRFGWETASRETSWRGRPEELPADPGERFVRPLAGHDSDGHAAVRRIHALTGRTGTCARDERRWRIIEAPLPGREWVVYQAPGEPITGYAIFERAATDPTTVTRVREMRGVNPAAQRGLLGFLSHSRPPADELEWIAPASELESFGLTDDGARATGMMLRLTDLPAALAAVYQAHFVPILTRGDRSLTVRAQDTLRPENELPIRLTSARVTVGHEDAPDWIAADIRVLARIYLGDCSPSEAYGEERLRASSDTALTLADALFPPRAPFVAPLDQF